MKVEGSYSIKADVQRAWDFLMDPDILASCIPGCESLKQAGEDSFEARLKLGVAAIKGSYTGKVVIFEKDKPHSFKLAIDGSGSSGLIKGEGQLNLSEGRNGATNVKVIGEASLGGPIARVGQRLAGGAAKLLMNQFFNCLRKKVN